jgi:5-methylcytosine-specific restriction endonuclease McrA
MVDAAFRLEGFSDEDLLVNLKRHVGCSNRLTALVLAHLAEVEARGAHRLWACPTLLIYCVYELRLSEDEAQRRCRAARVARRFPILFEMLAQGSIHLTGILLLAPYLTEENHRELLARASFRRKREIQKLVAELAPWAEVPAVVEPIGAGLSPWTKPRNTWARSVQSREGYVRELESGDGPAQAPRAPAEWVAALAAAGSAPEGPDGSQAVPRQELASEAESEEADGSQAVPRRELASEAESEAPVLAGASSGSGQGAARSVAALPAVVAAPARSLRYKIQFAADEAYVALLERARDLLQHRVPDRDLEKVQALAIAALVEQLERQKCGAPSRKLPAAAGGEAAAGHEAAASAEPPVPPADQQGLDAARANGAAEPQREEPQREEPQCEERATSNTRHLPAALRRSVWERDGGRCTYVDPRGVRCRETGGLEFHHRHAFALGGVTSVDNIELHCRPHNALRAEQDFGRAHILRKRTQETELDRNGPAPRAR